LLRGVAGADGIGVVHLEQLDIAGFRVDNRCGGPIL
jgi:hypothetical protein